MFLLDNTVVVSASDITGAGLCEFAFLRRADAKFGRDIIVPDSTDSMLERAATLGDQHEERQLVQHRERLGVDAVTEIDRPASFTVAGVSQRAAETVTALSSDASVIFQATFFDPQLRPAVRDDEPHIAFIGFADFLENIADRGERPIWQVQDTKLARSARVPALLQISAYAEQIARVGALVDTNAVLLLGDGSRSAHKLNDIAPVYRSRRERLYELVIESWGRGDTVTPWGDPSIHACGRCEVCEPEVQRARDPLLVAGMRLGQRQRLVKAGITTIDALATVDETQHVPGMTLGVMQRLVDQARVQVESERTGIPAVRVARPEALAAIPAPSEGDLFFDFEGDPMYRDERTEGDVRWGLDYLFGMVDQSETFTAFWAHDLAQERQALLDFLELVAERRKQYPSMHIYHYAPYERTHLLSIAARHGVGEAEVDELLRDRVLVDLYPIIRTALTVGSRSYSIKKLEPLYMGDELRDEDGVTDGAQSVVEYAEAARLLHSRDSAERTDAYRRLDAIADYNRYDCVSTLRLRDWLQGIAADHSVFPHREENQEEEEPRAQIELSETGARLLEFAALEEDQHEARALRLAASAIDYHQREQKSFWWAHFGRLTDPIEDWADTRDVVIVEPSWSSVSEDWHKPPRARKLRRHIELHGTVAPGSSLSEGRSMFAVYEPPLPYPNLRQQAGTRGARQIRVLERTEDGVLIEEMLPDDAEPWDELPIALTPGAPPHAGTQKSAIEEWGASLVKAKEQGADFTDPVFDLMRRKPPRLIGGVPPVSPDSDEALSVVDGDDEAKTIGAVIATLRGLDHSYVAVQGPPGTGKTYLASRVIRRLVEEDGWRIGVVAQSHKVVENVLEGIVKAGLDPAYVGKARQTSATNTEQPEPVWTVIKPNGHDAFLRDERRAGRGAVIGGTAWDFSNSTRCERGVLDLLVIDEAGQFSLAPTIAATVASERLLLLGDPQQLPQVSQGTHPEPVDTSALGWLIDQHDTLPESLGYFLAATRRMHPALAEIDSQLSYEGRLHAHPSTLGRIVHGIGAPGVTWHPQEHSGNATHAPEEADTVVRLVRETLHGTITEPGTPVRSLTEQDIIVVAAYNAQVECVTEALLDAGLSRVRVGTVDKFQGQEAVVAIVTLAASSPEEVPRGLDFLLMRNRLNVAISRAQWVAHLVSSRRLSGSGLPTSPSEVTALSGYLFLTEQGTGERPVTGSHRNSRSEVR